MTTQGMIGMVAGVLLALWAGAVVALTWND